MNALSLLLPMALAAPPAGPGYPPTVPGQPVLPPAAARLAGFPPTITPPCSPVGPPAPVLAARVIAPPGVRVTVSPGSQAARTFPAPAAFGFRPGYLYRLALSDLPDHPGQTLYPVLEVRGSLVPRAGMNVMDFPAPVYVDRADIEKAFAGGVVTKIVYLEDPTRAQPIQTTPDQPLELTDLTEEAARRAASDNGRVVAVLRLGDRDPDGDELARWALPGTVHCPGDGPLAAPPCPPVLPCTPVPLYDPIAGPKFPGEECFTDGGDTGPRLGVGPYGRVGGLNVTDVALAYTTATGKRKVTTSNVVCVCSPRYAIRRVDLLPAGVQVATGLDALNQQVGGRMAQVAVPVAAVANRVKPVGAEARLRTAIAVVSNGLASTVSLTAPMIVASESGVRVTAAVVEPAELTSAAELVVTKEVSPAGAVQPGDVVTFTIRYRNGRKDAVSDLQLSDSLSGRLEYVPGSAKSDRPANVSTAANEAGSAVVRYEIPGPVPPGGTGVVTFQARVR